jgi:hypothetical protein
VEDDGGREAPTVPAPEQPGGLGGLIPGLPQIPGLDELLPGLDDLFGGGAPDDLDGALDELLNDLMDDLLGGTGPQLPGTTPALGLFTVDEVPTGYTQGRTQIATEQGKDGVEGTHRVELEGADGTIVIEAERSSEAADRYDELNGQDTEVAGTDGKALTTGAIAFMADDDLLIVITPDKNVPASDVDDVADAIEVTK